MFVRCRLHKLLHAIRELDRSFYYANAYEYPIALLRLPDGREVIAHCPESYCRLEIDDLTTGKRLTKSTDRELKDYFFSRLTANEKGTKLLVAGWVWHPMDVIAVYDIEAALRDPHTLDSHGIGIWVVSEENSGAFIDNDTIAVTEFSEKEEYENDEDEDPVRVYESRTLSIYDLASGKQTFTRDIETRVGTFMPLGPDTIVSFYEHPKVIDIQTGKIIHEWPALKTGKQTSSIIWGIEPVPPLAIDAIHHRFAVATRDSIEVIQIKI